MFNIKENPLTATLRLHKMNPLSSFKSAISCQNQLMRFYQQQINQQQYLVSSFKKVLPEALAKHIVHAIIVNKNLLVYTNSATWASQLRFYQQAMLENAINTTNMEIKGINIRITMQNSSLDLKRVVNMPSKENIKLLRSCSESISDEKLRTALLNLSKTLDKLSS